MEGLRLTLEQHRRLKGYTASEMARRLGITRQTYYNWEAAPEKLTFEKGSEIAEALGVPFDDIIFLHTDSTKC